MAFSRDGKRIAAFGKARVLDVQSGKALLEFKHTGSIKCVAFSGDGSRLFSGADDGTLRVWDAHSGQPLLELRGPYRVQSAAFSGDGSRIVSGAMDGTMHVWDARGGLAPLAPLEFRSGPLELRTGPTSEEREIFFRILSFCCCNLLVDGFQW